MRVSVTCVTLDQTILNPQIPLMLCNPCSLPVLHLDSELAERGKREGGKEGGRERQSWRTKTIGGQRSEGQRIEVKFCGNLVKCSGKLEPEH